MLLLLACAPPPDEKDPDPAPVCEATGPMDDVLTLADVQALGTHNSYHVATDPALDPSLEFTQPPLTEQADLGVRAFELDVHIDTDGVFHVFHLPIVDQLTTCDTFADCLGVLRGWSDAHPCHSPLTVWIEPKDDLDGTVEGYTPLEGHMAELDAIVLDAWPRERLITPDDFDGTWPLLAASRGKMLLSILDSEERRAEYLDKADRLLFVKSDSPDDPFAATFKIDDPASSEIPDRVAEGFLVTSNVDGADDDDETNAARFAAGLETGVHNFASDRIVAVEGSEYVAELPGGSPRCHPRAGECGPEVIEPE